MAAERVWKLYQDDSSNTYNVLIPAWLFALAGANAMGFGAYDATKPRLPLQIKKRYITLTSTTTNRHRRLHAGSTGSAGWTTLGTNFTLPNIDGTTEVYTSTGRIGERDIRGPHA
jgi:hypothetical protein